jgi:hypothetical protein
LRIAFVERRLLQEQEDVMLNPLVKVTNWEQDSLGLVPGSAPLFAEAIGERLFLLRWLQFGQKQRMPVSSSCRASPIHRIPRLEQGTCDV